jgi:hypothetical protein
VKLSRERIEHSPNLRDSRMKDGGTEIWRGPTCECGIKERHAHCSACGRVTCIGSGKVIARYVMRWPL